MATSGGPSTAGFRPISAPSARADIPRGRPLKIIRALSILRRAASGPPTRGSPTTSGRRRRSAAISHRSAPNMTSARERARFATISLALKARPRRADMLRIQLDDRAIFLARWHDFLLALLDADSTRDHPSAGRNSASWSKVGTGTPASIRWAIAWCGATTPRGAGGVGHDRARPEDSRGGQSGPAVTVRGALVAARTRATAAHARRRLSELA